MLNQVAMLVQMLDVDATIDEHLGQQLRPMTVRRPSLTAHEDETMPVSGSRSDALDPSLEHRIRPAPRVIDVSFFVVTSWVGRAAAQRIAQEDVSDTGVTQGTLEVRLRERRPMPREGYGADVPQVLDALCSKQLDQLIDLSEAVPHHQDRRVGHGSNATQATGRLTRADGRHGSLPNRARPSAACPLLTNGKVRRTMCLLALRAERLLNTRGGTEIPKGQRP
jgi:hypothetical protein